MFSLIITIVGVALVVALVAATMYHGGGDTLTQGKKEAEIAKSLNELSQIQAALTSYHADKGVHATKILDLVPNYLSDVPVGWGADVPSQVAFESSRLLQGSETEKLNSCTEINKRLGLTGPPPLCSDISAGFAGCCEAPAV